MSTGPTQRWLDRARDWADDAEELASLQWQLLQLELAELSAELRSGLLLFVIAAGVFGVGFPLATVAGMAVLAQWLEWPLAPTLAIGGTLLAATGAAVGVAAKRSWERHFWFPRSRRQAACNLRSVIMSWKPIPRAGEAVDDECFPD